MAKSSKRTKSTGRSNKGKTVETAQPSNSSEARLDPDLEKSPAKVLNFADAGERQTSDKVCTNTKLHAISYLHASCRCCAVSCLVAKFDTSLSVSLTLCSLALSQTKQLSTRVSGWLLWLL